MKNGRLEDNKNYGICNLDMFVRKEEYYEKKNLIENESKNFKNIRTIKIEFTIYSMFLLLCKLKFFIILNKKYLYLANGKILSKGTNLLGRDFHNLKHQKIFDVVDFGNEEQEILIYDISTGKDYILALDKDYKVWGWGSNMRKQLDPKSDIKEFRKPRKLSLFVWYLLIMIN
jgi:alpha-tubulin suppressor-like RCC1 family protein